MSHIVLRTHDGVLLGVLQDVIDWEIARTANELGFFRIRMSECDRHLLAVDNLLEFYRTPVSSAPVLLGVGFLRGWEWSEDEIGRRQVMLTGPDQLDLLARRVVAYTDPEENWNKTDFADDMIKDIVRENMGTLSTDPWYSRGRALDPNHFEVAPDESLGREVTKEFQFREVLATCREVSEASGWPSSDYAWEGKPVFFDFDYVGPARFVFKTYCPLRGIDRTLATNVAPLIFSREAGNLLNPSLRFDYSQEQNIVYGLGPGDGETRMVDPENDVAREYSSIWNLREGVVNATEENTYMGIAWRSYNKMQELRPKVVFSGELLDTPQSRFGIDWNYGDIVTVRYLGMEFDGRIDQFHFASDAGNRDVLTAAVVITKALEGKPD